MCGLLHDMGKLLLLTLANDSTKFGVPSPSVQEIETVSRERHAEIGARLLRMWQLPGALENPVRYHHDPAASTTHSHEAAVTYVADRLVTLRLRMRGQRRAARHGSYLRKARLERCLAGRSRSLRAGTLQVARQIVADKKRPGRTRHERPQTETPAAVTSRRSGYTDLMQLQSARLCLDCDEVHDAQQCPLCASETFAFLTRWVPVPDRTDRPQKRPRAPEVPSPEALGAYREMLHPDENRGGKWRTLKPRRCRPGALRHRRVALAAEPAAGWRRGGIHA